MKMNKVNHVMTPNEQESLFSDNVKELNKMSTAAGSMIKGLIIELERDNRNTFIRLRDAEPGGHSVYFDFVQGDATLVPRIANALGLTLLANGKIEVPHV
jgi:hypothetical protein